MRLTIPELSLVVLVGITGSGKSTFASRHFKRTEILSSDFFRGLVSDDENDQSATQDAFEALHYVAGKRLASGRLTVVDATNVQPDSRKPLVALARQYHCLPVAIVLNLPKRVCEERNRDRPDRNFGPHVIHQQWSQLRRSIKGLNREGFRRVYVLTKDEAIAAVTVEREPLWNNLKHLHGPFDIIGDVHGCYEELVELLSTLGYIVANDEDGSVTVTPPEGRMAVFLGDLVDRGPGVVPTLRLVMGMAGAGSALCVPGNHDIKLLRKLRGKDVQIRHGLQQSLEQLEGEPQEFRERVSEFIDGLVSHYVLDDGRLVVAHAGMKESMQGRGSGAVRDFALFGETTGETDEFGLPVRYPWAQEYRGKAMVVYGHTPVPEAEWVNRTINIDTGCVFGGKLTALRYPELALVSVSAKAQYAEPVRPLEANALKDQRDRESLYLEDVDGKRVISTRLLPNITVRAENASAALEAMSRFAVDPRWLVYLPPTMSPCETSEEDGLLEHPREAFAYFRAHGVSSVVCEEKHMGSRAVVIVGRSASVLQTRFGVPDPGLGVCTTRTGRRFFNDLATEQQFLDRIRNAAEQCRLWERLKTGWLCLDCELMPWSAKARELLRLQYAPVGLAAKMSLNAAARLLTQATTREGFDQDAQAHVLLQSIETRASLAERYVDAYRNYCWTVNSVEDIRLAPFHLLASEGRVYTDLDHSQHMSVLAELATHDPVLVATPFRAVDLSSDSSVREATEWWTELTNAGGEGMVVKPRDFVSQYKGRLIQPAVKCRGPEYLRIIYGPEYTLPHHLKRLRARGLSGKRSLALREFALGIEALERFVNHEPLYRVHECVFGVLAMESEPVDPRL